MEGSAAVALRAGLLGLGLLLPALGAAAERTVSRADWSAPATLEAAAARPLFHETLADYLAEPGNWVRIAHGGGASGSAWAHDVLGWLVALGVPGDQVQLDPAVVAEGRLALSVHARGERL